MTELNQNTLAEAAPDVAWPEVPLSEANESGTTAPDSAPSGSAASDTTVQAVLGRVRDIPGLPVSEHPAAYADMHDALLEALNEETPGQDDSSAPGAGAGAA